MSKSNWRIYLTIALVILAVVAFWDTFRLWTMSDAEKARMQEEKPGELLKLQQDAIRLGLDLQGGIHVVLRVDMTALAPTERDGAVERAIAIIRNRVDGLGVAEPSILKQGEDRIVVDLPGYTDANRAEELIGQTALLEFKLLEGMDNAQLLMAKTDSVVHAYEMMRAGTSGQTVPEPQATPPASDTGESDVLSELMGTDTGAADTGDDPFGFDENAGDVTNDKPLSSRLQTALYSQQTNESWPGFYVQKTDKELIDRWLTLPEVQNLMPIDVQWAWSTRAEVREAREVYTLYLLKRKVQFLGKFLENIRLGQGQYGEFSVDFTLSGDGAARFAQLTGANINKPLAIVLDDRVESAPMINSKIRQNGQITMGGAATMEDARNLEIVLKAGALPAPVQIIEKNVVGASLGADSIRKGFYASLVGLLLVILYMAVYYRISGVIADVGMLFNIFFLLAFMGGLGFTLSMPGIAGIILTIGISVDANILIFERIREELRTGKTIRAAIEAGYDRAFVAIFDSHVTTLITAAALFALGSGPIKGFAVTLFLGVSFSLYTAYVITKQIFDIRKAYKALSI